MVETEPAVESLTRPDQVNRLPCLFSAHLMVNNDIPSTASHRKVSLLTKEHRLHRFPISGLHVSPIGAQEMKNVYEVLRQKEIELARLEKEVEALRMVAPLLSEEKAAEMADLSKNTATAAAVGQTPIRLAQPAAVAAPAPAPARSAGWEDTAKRWP